MKLNFKTTLISEPHFKWRWFDFFTFLWWFSLVLFRLRRPYFLPCHSREDPPPFSNWIRHPVQFPLFLQIFLHFLNCCFLCVIFGFQKFPRSPQGFKNQLVSFYVILGFLGLVGFLLFSGIISFFSYFKSVFYMCFFEGFRAEWWRSGWCSVQTGEFSLSLILKCLSKN